MAWPALGPGRLLERCGDAAPRGMTVHDRTRLIGRLPISMKGVLGTPSQILCESNMPSADADQVASRFRHTSVLLDGAVDALIHDPDGVYLDGTFGRGGHSRLILSRLSEQGRLLAMDRDPQAIAAAEEITDPRFQITRREFARLAEFAQEQGVHGRLSGILLDIGVSSPQLDDPERGFSFMRNGPLDMRMDPTQGESAASFLAGLASPRLPVSSRPTAKSATPSGWPMRWSSGALSNPLPIPWIWPRSSRQPTPPGRRADIRQPKRFRGCAFTSTANWSSWIARWTQPWRPWRRGASGGH